jgi:hypothetical protein
MMNKILNKNKNKVSKTLKMKNENNKFLGGWVADG